MNNKPMVPSIWKGEDSYYFVYKVDSGNVYYLYYPEGMDVATDFKNTFHIWEEEVIASGVTMIPVQ